MRLTIGTNNLDSSARYGHVNGVQAMRLVQGTHRWTVTFEDIVQADVLLLVGTNITETNPITGLKVKEAVKKHDATLLTIEAIQPAIGTISNISNLSQQHFCVAPSQFGAAVLGLLKAVVEGNHIDRAIRQRAPDYVSAVSQAVQQLAWDDLALSTGVPRESFVQMAASLAGGRRVVVLAGQILLRSQGGYGICLNLLDLLLLTGKLTAPGCGFAPLAEENNDQGAVEMGAVAATAAGRARPHRSGRARADYSCLERGSPFGGRGHTHRDDRPCAGRDHQGPLRRRRKSCREPSAPDRSQRGAEQTRSPCVPGTVSYGNGCARPCGAPGRLRHGESRNLHQYRGPCPGRSARDRSGRGQPSRLGNPVGPLGFHRCAVGIRRRQRDSQRDSGGDSRLRIARPHRRSLPQWILPPSIDT